MPAAFQNLVSYIGGLTSVPNHSFFRTETHTAPAQAGVAGVHPNLTASATTHFVTPLDFAQIYDIPSAATGSGQKVMIIGGSRLNPADLSYWETDTALAGYTPNYIVGTGFTDPGQTNDDNMGEGTLDFERVYGTAPGAQVDQVIAKNWLNGTTNQQLVLYAINTVNDPVMSLSFGACELDQPAGYVKQEDAMYSQAAAQGISVLVSSGDAGVAGCEAHDSAPVAPQVASISDICASSYVTCVGGTEFNDTANPATYWASTNGYGFLSALGYIPEGAWNEPSTTSTATPFVVAASGGGPSTIITKPTWQIGTGVPADGFRDTPDISFAAAGHDGYFSCLAYAGTATQNSGCVPAANGSFGFIVFSGTSASAPSMAGVAALLDAKLGARQGNLNPTLYKLAASSPAAFHDATIASSGVSGCSTATPSLCNNSDPAAATLTGGIAGYALQTGYDLVTGLGSLDVGAFLNAASVTAAPTTTSNLTAAPATIATNQTVVFTDVVSTVAATGVPSGNVVFTSGSTTLATIALAANASGNSASAVTSALSFPTAGTYVITATYAGGTSGLMGSAATLTLVVTAPALPSTTTTLTGTTGTITAQTGASYTAVVAPSVAGATAVTGTVQFTRTSSTGQAANLGAAVSVVAGRATLGPVTVPVGTYSISAVYSGDTNFAGSTSNLLAVMATTVPSKITLSGIPATTNSTSSFPFSAMVVSSTGTGSPTGTVQATVDGSSLLTPSGPLSQGSTNAVTFTALLTTGTHTICATYSGDTTFSSSTTSPCTSVVVASTPVTLSLTPVAVSISSYQMITLPAVLNGVSTTVAATAQVSYSDTFTSLAGVISTSSLGSAAPAGTTGGLVAGPLAAGVHKITAFYPGDASYSSASSNTITVTVLAASITLTPASAAISTSAGSTVTDLVTLVSTNFAGSLTVGCSIAYNGTGAAVNAPTCSLSGGGSVTLISGGTAASTITISSTKPTLTQGGTFASAKPMTLSGLAGATLCGLLAFCLPRRQRRFIQAARIFSCLVFLAAVLLSTSGCGSNNFNSTKTPGTSTGSYTVTVTAGSAVTGSTTIALTIQ